LSLAQFLLLDPEQLVRIDAPEGHPKLPFPTPLKIGTIFRQFVDY